MPDALPTAAIDTSQFVPNPEVVGELLKSPLPREARAFILQASVETMLGVPLAWPYPWSQFRCLFGFVEWTGSLDAFPPWPGNAAHNTHAAGFLQDEPATYAGIVKLTGDSGFTPQSQIANNWVLAVRDFGIRSGGSDLLTTLQVGGAQLERISPALTATWPEGCDSNFPARYIQALALFPVDPMPEPPVPPPTTPPEPPVPEPAPPPPPSPATPSNPDLQIPLGYTFSMPITGTLAGQTEPVPVDALNSSDPKICPAIIVNGSVVLPGVALGNAQITTAPDIKLMVQDTNGPVATSQFTIAVVAPRPDTVTINPAAGKLSKTLAAAAGGVVGLGVGAALMFAMPSHTSSELVFPPAVIAAAPAPITCRPSYFEVIGARLIFHEMPECR